MPAFFGGDSNRVYTGQVRLRGLLKPAKAGFVYVDAVSNQPICGDAGIVGCQFTTDSHLSFYRDFV